MSATDDHRGLGALAREAVETLIAAPRLRRRGTVHFEQHSVFADRCHDLGLQLEGALRLSDAHLYASSLCLIRGALEHRLFDSQLFLATTVRERRHGLTLLEFQNLEAQRSADPELKRAIRRITRNAGGLVEIVWDGPWVANAKGERQYRLSVFYAHLENFTPFSLSDRLQPELASEFTTLDQHVTAAKDHLSVWYNVRWDRLLENAKFSRTLRVRDGLKLEVHYGFLSFFVHPFSLEANARLFGAKGWQTTPYYDHYASELVLLYVASIACWEIEDFLKMSRRKPRAPLDEPGPLERLVAERRRLCSYFWFVGDEPHMLDLVNEANYRGIPSGKLVPSEKRTPPTALKPSQVKYYRDPLRRLVQMHSSFREFTGYAFQSDWPRADAFLRS